jgi:hypothetical protein
LTLAAKLLTELVGSFVFFTVIGLSGHAGALAPLAIGVGAAIHRTQTLRSPMPPEKSESQPDVP